MRFKLDDSLFDNVDNFQNIQEFISCASRKNNQIVVVMNPKCSGYLNYKCKIGSFLSEKSDLFLNKTISMFHLFKSPIYTVVDAKLADGNKISIIQAINYINKPFYIYLENDRNDKNFIKFFCDDSDLRILNELEGSSELDYMSGGGVGELKNKVMNNDFNPDKSFVLCDSDSLPLMKQETVNTTAIAIRDYSVGKNIKFHMLNRRFIESYLPVESLKHYVYRDYNNDNPILSCEPKHKKLLDAFLKIECKETKYHFNLKRGIIGDSKRYNGNKEEAINMHYKNINKDLLDDLMHGFGDNLSKSYENPVIKISDKMKDKEAWDEVNGIVKSILRVV